MTELSGRILSVQDDERRRLGQNLHDSSAQTLTAVALNLALVQSDAKRLTVSARRALVDSIALVDQCSRELRTIAYLLHPPLLDEIGLLSAVRWYAEGFAKRSGIVAEVDAPHDGSRMPQDR